MGSGKASGLPNNCRPRGPFLVNVQWDQTTPQLTQTIEFPQARCETKQQYVGHLRTMLKPCLRPHSVLSPSVLGELEAKGVQTSKIANIPFRSRGITLRLFSRRIRRRSSWRQRPAGKPLKRSGRKADDPRPLMSTGNGRYI